MALTKHGERIIFGAVGTVIVLTLWQVAALRTAHTMILPFPAEVARTLLSPAEDLLGTGTLAKHLLASVSRVALGFCTAALTAVPLGIIAGRIRRLRLSLGPVVEFLLPISPLAWTPFTLIFFRTETIASLVGFPFHYGLTGQIQIGMVAIVFYSTFFPIYINTAAGVKNIPRMYHETAGINGCSLLQTFVWVDLPAILPSVFSGIKIGFGMGWRSIIGAEMLPGTTAGLGFLLTYAYQLAEMHILVASLVLIGVTGALGNTVLSAASIPIRRWHGEIQK
ncbi:MAG: ABC transporter permease [Fibrobacterota bacterium]